MREQLSVLSKALKEKEISSAELTESYIKKIETKNPTLNAYVHETFEEARKGAAEADARLGRGESGALLGIPMGLKDNICTDGLLTTCCSKILKDFRPYYDATAVTKLKKAGAVLLGKTNMDEFAMGSTSETSCYGAPKNPVNTAHVTGGSSGGSAAVVAGDLAAYALGSDTGGSIRQPASFCGVVGLKPSYGAVSRYGLIAYGSSLDQIGPITTSVKDAAIVFDAIKGSDVNDQTARLLDTAPVADKLTGDLPTGKNGKLRIGIAKEYFEGLNPEIADAVMKAVSAYADAGAEIVQVSLPELKSSLPVYYIIACAEASSNLGRYDGIRYGYRAENYKDVDDMIYKTRSEGFGQEVKKRIMLGTYVLSSGYFDAYYKKACILRNQIRERFDELFTKCDVLMAPTAPNTAFKLGDSSISSTDLYLSDIATVPVNIAGVPAVSIPVGTDGAGLPIGMQIIGNRFDEETILKAGYFYEKNVEGGVQ